MSNRMTSDFLIIGGGVVGLGVSLELKRRFPEVSVTLVEKEDRCGIHASSRNSGVLHAGFYYASDSLKAQLTARGNAALTEYCLERGLPISRCGKLVVAQNEGELDTLDELFRRARTNGVDVRIVSAEEAREIEPGVRTVERALFSPTTSSVDPGKVVASLADDAARSGVRLRVGTAYRGWDGERVMTTDGAVSAGIVINAAGVYPIVSRMTSGLAPTIPSCRSKGCISTRTRVRNPLVPTYIRCRISPIRGSGCTSP